MKATNLALWFILFAISSHGQDIDPAKSRAWAVNHFFKGQSIRVVTNQIFNAQSSPLWDVTGGIVTSKTDDNVLILNISGTSRFIALRNYSGDATDQRYVSTLAMRVGTYDWGSSPLEFWDCGIPYVAPPPTPLTSEQRRLAIEAQAKAKIDSDKNKLDTDAKALKYNQELASKGDPYGEYRMGMRYLVGNGVETNRVRAFELLRNASANGSVEASNKLVSLNK